MTREDWKALDSDTRAMLRRGFIGDVPSPEWLHACGAPIDIGDFDASRFPGAWAFWLRLCAQTRAFGCDRETVNVWACQFDRACTASGPRLP